MKYAKSAAVEIVDHIKKVVHEIDVKNVKALMDNLICAG